ncbi:bacitracin ABC transport system permease protein BceB [Clostridium aceticum]|uniref:Bacitracin ABC transport system permease protein BceB n=1 Tax=Clostridium aceticum TaxID=84022 RepID=A0A0D8I8H4_9CLOT|nr:FtsX-like permease family protein [Clostridium aceticum]AKL96099.1 bacitracin ABC transport system permease protein BceB [Clostridium aceticum]KJF25536.1 bacitracin ABC transporter permease [Clostridium aceticum]
MSINQLIIRSLQKNLKSYYLYVFALIFSTALYFSFVTLQYNPSMDQAAGSIRGLAAIRSISVVLIMIVSVFLLYANNLFIKRRSKEIGLFQLIGMTKNRIFMILSAENLLLYFGSLLIGTFIGFAVSKLVAMVLFKVTDMDAIASLYFSGQAFIQTLQVFGGIYFLIMLMNYVFIKHQSILSLFHLQSKTESRVKKISIVEILIGILGLVLISTGYYVSARLFDGDFVPMNNLFSVMIFILTSVIIGTYFFYKGSVRFIANMIRKNKDGYLNINEVMSLSSIMFRMKSNAMLLTIITTVSALAIGLLSLNYISYYSVEKNAKSIAPTDFAFVTTKNAEAFGEVLRKNGIAYNEQKIDVLQVEVDIQEIMGSNIENLQIDGGKMRMSVISDRHVEDIDVSEDETVFSGFNDAMQTLLNLQGSGTITLHGLTTAFSKEYLGLLKDNVLPLYFTGGLPTAIVDETTFATLSNDMNPEIQLESSIYIGYTLDDRGTVKAADKLFNNMPFSQDLGNSSQYSVDREQKIDMGFTMFSVGFLGLAFLITSGCILYFKQVEEGDEEQLNYKILRKLGFTQKDLLQGILRKQLFNFGIPLILGLLHSYFAVKSGWFFFGTELWTPMIIVMGLYAALYSVFCILSVVYYKRVIKMSL